MQVLYQPRAPSHKWHTGLESGAVSNRWSGRLSYLISVVEENIYRVGSYDYNEGMQGF